MDTNNVTTTDTTWTVSYYTPTISTNCLVNWSYPFYTQNCTDRTAKAYEIAKMLMAKKLVECRTVKQFTDLMDELVKVL